MARKALGNHIYLWNIQYTGLGRFGSVALPSSFKLVCLGEHRTTESIREGEKKKRVPTVTNKIKSYEGEKDHALINSLQRKKKPSYGKTAFSGSPSANERI